MNTNVLNIALSDEFFDQIGKLTPNIRKKLHNFLSKIRKAPDLNGLNIEKLNTKPSEYYSVRVDDNYRIIFVKISNDRSCVYTFLYIAAHDDAYDWANRHTCEINSRTHSIQLYETLTVETVPSSNTSSNVQVKTEEAPQNSSSPQEFEGAFLFADFENDDLLSIGVPEKILSIVKKLQTKDELEAISKNLSADVFESLMWLADGDSIKDIKAAYGDSEQANDSDPVSSFKTKRSRRSFKVVETDEVMKQIINVGTEKWRVFLHPMQEDLVKNNVDCTKPLAPMLVRGAAGTGKTVVALHRAASLVKSSHWPRDEKLLFVTYTTNLAVDIEAMLKKLCDPDEMQRVEVKNFDSWLSSFLKQNEVQKTIAYGYDNAKYKKCWEEARALIPLELGLPDSFYPEEWERIILPNEIMSEQEYLRVKRLGRGTSLSRNQRKEIWPVFETLRTSMIAKGIMAFEDACFTAIHILKNNPGLCHYRAVVVDEAQDLGNETLTLLAMLCKSEQSGEPHIFLAGDGRQRIYKRVGSLLSCGIKVQGRRSTRLRVSYRTTDEIRKAANAVLLKCNFNDMDEGSEVLKGESSLRHGHKPEVYFAKDFDDECDWIVSQINELLHDDNGAKLNKRDFCLVCRTNPLIERYQQALLDRGFNCSLLARKKSDSGSIDEIRLATMHRVKGLEFPVIFICGANENVVPWKSRSKDNEQKNSDELTERSLFYVAASRARDNLFVSSSGKPGEFIKLLA